MNFKLKVLSLISVVTVLVCVSCKKDNKQTVAPVTGCDTVNVTYSTVEPIFKNNCIVCHSPTGGASDLTSETAIKGSYTSLEIINSINHLSGGNRNMPRGGSKMSDCDIKKITIWLNNQTK